MKVKKFYEDIYKTHLLFIYDCKAFEAMDYLNKQGIRTDLVKCSGQTGSYTHRKGKDFEQNRYYVYIEKEKDMLNTLVHEIAHLVFMSLDDCGIQITRETDEIYAYYYEYWFKKLYPLLELKKALKSKKK